MTQPHRARKRFGQNFLQDQAVIQRIISAIAPQADDRLVEIGPGLGALTLPLLSVCKQLQVIELDRDIIPRLRAKTQGRTDLGELQIHSADALQFDYRSLYRKGETRDSGAGKLRLIGNLPYNISTPLLFHLLSQADCIHDMHFMLQKEVVERMAAEPGSRSYGRLTVGLALQADCEPLFLVPPAAFNPAPKVDSAIVRITPRPGDQRRYTDRVAQVVSQAFSMRRKTLGNALKGLLSREDILAAGVDPGLRPEQISPQQYCVLASQGPSE